MVFQKLINNYLQSNGAPRQAAIAILGNLKYSI